METWYVVWQCVYEIIVNQEVDFCGEEKKSSLQIKKQAHYLFKAGLKTCQCVLKHIYGSGGVVALCPLGIKRVNCDVEVQLCSICELRVLQILVQTVLLDMRRMKYRYCLARLHDPKLVE